MQPWRNLAVISIILVCENELAITKIPSNRYPIIISLLLPRVSNRNPQSIALEIMPKYVTAFKRPLSLKLSSRSHWAAGKTYEIVVVAKIDVNPEGIAIKISIML